MLTPASADRRRPPRPRRTVCGRRLPGGSVQARFVPSALPPVTVRSACAQEAARAAVLALTSFGYGHLGGRLEITVRCRGPMTGPARRALLRAQRLAATRAVSAALRGGPRTVRVRVCPPP
ncbi:hypothetical protein ACX6XY_26645 [Streptomyces sp. O3]